MRAPNFTILWELNNNFMKIFHGVISKYGIGFIGCLIVTLLASIPLYGIIFLPSLDGPDHWMTVKVVINTLKGKNQGWELVFIPAYKLFYFVNTPLFYLAEVVGITPKALPSLSIVLLNFIFSSFVGLKYVQMLNQHVKKRGIPGYTLGMTLSLILTLFATLALNSASLYMGFLSFVYSVPFAVLTLMILEDCIALFNKKKLLILTCLLFLSYTGHPLSIFFLTVWAVIRMLIYYSIEFAKGSRLTRNAFIPFATFFIVVFVLAIFHHLSLPREVGLDFSKLIDSLLHPFNQPYYVYKYLKETFLYAMGFTAEEQYIPSLYSLVGLILIVSSLLLCIIFGGWRSRLFQINLTIIIFLMLNAAFKSTILFSPNVGIYFRIRVATICFTIAFALAGYCIISNQKLIRNWIIVVTISTITAMGALYQIRSLSYTYDRFNRLSQEVYMKIKSRPAWGIADIDNFYKSNQFRYSYGNHFDKYACLYEGFCKSKLFHERHPNWGIFPLKPIIKNSDKD